MGFDRQLDTTTKFSLKIELPRATNGCWIMGCMAQRHGDQDLPHNEIVATVYCDQMLTKQNLTVYCDHWGLDYVAYGTT
jgi:hypothetical protein